MAKQKPDKIKKVTIEYEHSTYVAEGKDAEAWLAYVSFMESLCALFHPPAFDWTNINKQQKKGG